MVVPVLYVPLILPLNWWLFKSCRGSLFSLYESVATVFLQVLAINRAEKEKIISVVLQIHERCRQNFIHWIEEKWIPRNISKF